MKPIPVRAAAEIAKKYGYDQVIVMARRVGDNGGEHVTTYGSNKIHCDVAARVGNFLKHKIMGWPEFPAANEIVMPQEATKHMTDAMNAITSAMLESVNKIDVTLIYGTAVQCEIGRTALWAAGMDEDGIPLKKGKK